MNTYPDFEKGKLLNIKMLNALRDYPVNFAETIFYGYSDGIINGFDVQTDGEKIFVSAGILKYNGKILFLENSVEMEILDGIVYANLKVCETRKDNCTDTEIVIEQEYEKGNFELFRYIHNEGAELKNIPNTFDKIVNYPRNTINISNQINSGCDGREIPSKEIFKLYAGYILSGMKLSPEDYAFAYQCLNGIKSYEIIKQYLGCKDNLTASEIILMLDKKIKTSERKIFEEDKKTSVRGTERMEIC